MINSELSQELYDKIKSNLIFNRVFRQAYLNYGYLPMLLVMDEYEQKEYYNTCYLMLEVIKQVDSEVSRGLSHGLVTRFGSEAINLAQEDFNNRGWADRWENYLNEVPNYAIELKKFIEERHENFKY